MKVLLTGPPGIGKTTVIVKLAALLEDHTLAGFVTEEVRTQGVRVGFRLRTFSGDEATIAHADYRGPARVGRYGVDVPMFEALAVPELSRRCDLFVVDEIGKMECFSAEFVGAMRAVLDQPTPLVATVAARAPGFPEEVRRLGEAGGSAIRTIEVDHANRDRLAPEIAALLFPDDGGRAATP